MKQEREKMKNIMLNTSSRILENVNIKLFPGYVITGSFKDGKAHFLQIHHILYTLLLPEGQSGFLEEHSKRLLKGSSTRVCG